MVSEIVDWASRHPRHNWITLFLEPQLIDVTNVALGRSGRIQAYRDILVGWEARTGADADMLYDTLRSGDSNQPPAPTC